MKGLVDIIILRFNTPKCDEECILGILHNTKYPFYQVTLFDNYHPKFPLSKIWNKLISRSYGQYICLMNNDTVPAENWLGKLIEVFDREQNVGAVGPSTNQCNNPQKVEHYPRHYEVVDFEEEFGKKFQLSGFCLLFPKRIWRLVGKFDERFGFYAQENEFLHRVQQFGYRTLWRKDAFVWHVGEASAKKLESEGGFNRAEERRRGNILYRKAVKGEL